VAIRATELALAPALYLGLSIATHAAWRVSRRGGLALFGFMLMLDGVYLAWLGHLTGGGASPVRYLILAHLVGVALLASYRTAMKVALWHSLLLLVVYYGQRDGLLADIAPTSGPNSGAMSLQQLLVFSGALWFVALATSSFSAINERELRRRRWDLEALAGMATRIEELTESAAVATAVVDSIVEAFDFRRAVLLGRPDGSGFALLSTNGRVIPAPVRAPEAGSVIELAMGTRSTQ